MTSLYVASMRGHVGAVTSLLEGKADVGSIDKVHESGDEGLGKKVWGDFGLLSVIAPCCAKCCMQHAFKLSIFGLLEGG
jgi:hypothetical protein